MLRSANEQEDRVRSYRLGVNGYVLKPIYFAWFQKTVGQLGLYRASIDRAPRPD